MKLMPQAILIYLLFTQSSLLHSDEMQLMKSVASFELTEQNGQTVRLSDLSGNVWIANFIFTRCQGMCPLMSGRMAELQKKISNLNIKFVSFSVDPEFDTPEVLREYAKKYNANPKRWLFLTGSKDVIWDLIMSSFQLGIEQASRQDLEQGAELVMHSNRFVLVNKDGIIVSYFDTSEPSEINRLEMTARQLAENKRAL